MIVHTAVLLVAQDILIKGKPKGIKPDTTFIPDASLLGLQE